MTQEVMNSRFGSGEVKRIFQDAKVGATSSWTVRAGADSFMATLAASSTADATLVFPLHGLHVGDVITGYHLIGQIDSAGNAVTLDAQLYESLAVAAASTHTGKTGTAMTQLSVTADTKVNELNAVKKFAAADLVTVAEDAAYFVLVDATTLASTDIELLGLVLHVKPKVGG